MARPETERLFQDEVPSVPYAPSSLPAPSPSFAEPVTAIGSGPLSTIDESVWETIKRDIVTIGRNLRAVLIPVQGKFSEQEAALRNWDLWGPLVFILALSISVSKQEPDPSATFATVFTIVGVGAVVLTVNVVLLGGEIVFLQSLCLLGYCLFPLVVSSIIVVSMKLHAWLVGIIVLSTVAWSAAASIPFISQTVPASRRMLAIYPVVLLYTTVAWFIASAAVRPK